MSTVDGESPREAANPRDAEEEIWSPDMRRILESHGVLLWVGSPDGTRRWIGHALAKFTGRSQTELVGPGWIEALHPQDSERCAAIDLHCLAADRRYTLDYRLQCRDGRAVWMMDSANPCYDAAGRFTGHIGVCVDIHARRVAEDEIAERLQKIRIARRS